MKTRQICGYTTQKYLTVLQTLPPLLCVLEERTIAPTKRLPLFKLQLHHLLLTHKHTTHTHDIFSITDAQFLNSNLRLVQ